MEFSLIFQTPRCLVAAQKHPSTWEGWHVLSGGGCLCAQQAHSPLSPGICKAVHCFCGHQTVGTGTDCASRELTGQTVRGWGVSAGHSCGIHKRVSTAVSIKKSWFSGPGREILFAVLTLHRSNHKGLAGPCLGKTPFICLVSAQMALSVWLPHGKALMDSSLQLARVLLALL